MPNLFDTHSHLNDRRLIGDVAGVISRAAEAGVSRIICSGYDLPSSIAAVEIAGRFENVWATVGVHPHDAKTVTDEVLGEIKRLAADPKVVAIGEIGLDYHYDLSPRPVQAEVFRAQLKLAVELGMRVVIHERESGDDAYHILKEIAPPSGGTMHCFAGDIERARQMIDLGFYLGVAGTVTFKKAETLREVVREAPIERLLIETDAPYLTPEPFRGRKQNEPALVSLVAERIAEIRGMTPEEVAEITTANALRIYPKVGGIEG